MAAALEKFPRYEIAATASAPATLKGTAPVQPRKRSDCVVALKRKRDCTQGRQIGQLARDVTRYSRRYTKGLSRVRGCFVTRLAERPCLLGKRIHLRLHELTLNSKNLLKILGLAQLPYALGGSGDVSLSIGFHFFS